MVSALLSSLKLGRVKKVTSHVSAADAESIRFDDLPYSFRHQHITLQERQSFMLQGIAWKQGGGGSRPLDNLGKDAL